MTESRMRLPEIEQTVCDLAARQLYIPRHEVSPESRLIEDLYCDSLELLDLMFTLERTFAVILDVGNPASTAKSIFTRRPFRLRDLAEIVYVQQGMGVRERSTSRRQPRPTSDKVPFTQLDGRWSRIAGVPLFEVVEPKAALPIYRRRSDGMRCRVLPSAEVEIGAEGPESLPDEGPRHIVALDAFAIDMEPVSTTAYCRFLNSIDGTTADHLTDWFVLDPSDKRREHVQTQQGDDGWQPLVGTERAPMVLVSWYGAQAYSLWANGRSWTEYRQSDAPIPLPTEAQWEYAVRGFGPEFADEEASAPTQQIVCGQHEIGQQYTAETLAMAAVNERLGMSPFGLHHMAGNIWHWCRDWYDEAFYRRSDASGRNPVNREPTGVRSERGGSWVGPAELCRPTYRRGRNPAARGRCLGFRCISEVPPV
ncbi:MAG TPA: SUMF1/EgtB/PvdO family nonheme iron enzyme [Planctomycetaceae bacterium]|nr:SUMF1/EgtB/PvdO family nonheme iron enzyme [Planctomycetaceae bacterium]